MEKKAAIIRDGGTIIIGSFLLIVIYLTSLYSYLLFHSVIELFTIIVAAGIFVIAWNARSYINNNYLLFIAIASIFVALLDFFHTLTYEGMGVFANRSANPATQLWIAARYVQSISWLIAPVFLNRKLKLNLQFAVYAIVTLLLLASIFYWQNFPVAYADGVGLTAFKKISEYGISFLFLGAIGFLLWKRQEFDPNVLRLLVISLTLTIGSEIAFAYYVSVYGEANLIGHFLRLAAFYFLYKAIIETGLTRPYTILVRDLKLSEQRLREYGLIQQTRNEELTRSEAKLRGEAVTMRSRNEELTRSEARLRDDTVIMQIRNEELMRLEKQLREDAIALQTRNEELDAYAHTVAHDLKNPLSILIATADIITDVRDLTRKELKEFLQQIKSIAFEMNNIVDSLLLLSEVRKVDAPIEPIDMAKVVTAVRNRLSYMVKEYHGHIILSEDWPIAVGYEPWIKEVWANYLSNALKYGGPSPIVELGASTQTDGTIRFWTRDHGPGIPTEEQTRLFMPFTQLGKMRKRGGHGLGLSIVYHIVEKLGGTVGVESEVGKGSLFYFTLPADTACNEGTANNLSTKIRSETA